MEWWNQYVCAEHEFERQEIPTSFVQNSLQFLGADARLLPNFSGAFILQ
jgi:hypothetical protein